MFLLFGLALAVAAFVWWLRRRRRPGEVHPLAGYDSGVRSPYRTPGRFGHRRGMR